MVSDRGSADRRELIWGIAGGSSWRHMGQFRDSISNLK